MGESHPSDARNMEESEVYMLWEEGTALLCLITVETAALLLGSQPKGTAGIYSFQQQRELY